jgi:hypothetical protein
MAWFFLRLDILLKSLEGVRRDIRKLTSNNLSWDLPTAFLGMVCLELAWCSKCETIREKR